MDPAKAPQVFVWPPMCAYVERIPTKRDKNNCWRARDRALRSVICVEHRELRGEPLPLCTREGELPELLAAGVGRLW